MLLHACWQYLRALRYLPINACVILPTETRKKKKKLYQIIKTNVNNMHDRPMPPHACAAIRKNATIATTAATIQQNMYKYANTRKMSRFGKCLGNAENGNGCGRRTATHGKLYAAVKTWNLCTRIKTSKKKKTNVESEKIERTCENENEKKKQKKINAEQNDTEKRRRRRCRRTWREWVRWLAEYQEFRQLRCPEDFRAPVWRASSSARSGCATPMMIC